MRPRFKESQNGYMWRDFFFYRSRNDSEQPETAVGMNKLKLPQITIYYIIILDVLNT